MRHWGTNSTVFRPESRSLLQCLSCSTLHIACFHPETLLGLEICSKSSLNAPKCTSRCSQVQHLGSRTALGLRRVYTARPKLQNWQALDHACSGESLQRAQHLLLFWKGHNVCELPSQHPTVMSAPCLCSYWRSTNQMNSSTPMWSGHKSGGSRLPSQYTCLYARTFWFCFLLNSCQWSKRAACVD